MSLPLALAALALWALATFAYVRSARPRPGWPAVAFLDLPLGLSVDARLELSAVAARERARSALLRSNVFRAEVGAGGRVSFRQGNRPSPWLGALRSSPPPIFVGSFVTEPVEPSGSRLLVRFSTVPVAGWALLGLLAVAVVLVAAWLEGWRGLWFWVAAAALVLAVRAVYQAEARRLGWQVVALLGFGPQGAQGAG